MIANRRAVLELSDRQLDDLEELRVEHGDECRVPPRLAARLDYIARAVAFRRKAPANVADAHSWVLDAQERLLVAEPPAVMRGPKSDGVGFSRDRATGWLEVYLPPRGRTNPEGNRPGRLLGEEDWWRLAGDTVQRAEDRWSYANEQAQRAARNHDPNTSLALDYAEAAWENYWRLDQELQELRSERWEERQAA